MTLHDNALLREAEICNLNKTLFKQNVLNKTRGKCAICGEQLDLDSMTIDHYIPISRGGRSIFNNLYPLCGKCNVEKSNKIIYPENCYPILSLEFITHLDHNFDRWKSNMRKTYMALNEILLKQNGKITVIKGDDVDFFINKSFRKDGIELISRNELGTFIKNKGISFEDTIDLDFLDMEFNQWIDIGQNIEIRLVPKKGANRVCSSYSEKADYGEFHRQMKYKNKKRSHK